jgi:hypothetical protein
MFVYAELYNYAKAISCLATVTKLQCTEGCRLPVCSRWSQVILCVLLPRFQPDEIPSSARYLPSFRGECFVVLWAIPS